MCIRDSLDAVHEAPGVDVADPVKQIRLSAAGQRNLVVRITVAAVSYTHLLIAGSSSINRLASRIRTDRTYSEKL